MSDPTLSSRPSPWLEHRWPALWRRQPEDFAVTECMPPVAGGDGEHWWIWVEKRGQNTDWVARQLAQAFGVREVAVGYAGLKDRHAVTGQWMSIQLPGHKTEPVLPELDGVKWGTCLRSLKKCRRGDHVGNRFSIRLYWPEGDGGPDVAEVGRILTDIRTHGFPNYYGHQRFGIEGRNLEKGRAWMAGRWRPGGRHVKSMVLSALRSEVFNALLAERVRHGSWNAILEGERQTTAAAPGNMTSLACAEGPLWGGLPVQEGEAGRFEQAVNDRYDDVLAFLHRQGLRPDWRPFVAMPENLAWHWLDRGMQLDFTLGRGVYASVLLEMMFELIQPDRREVA